MYIHNILCYVTLVALLANFLTGTFVWEVLSTGQRKTFVVLCYLVGDMCYDERVENVTSHHRSFSFFMALM